MVIQFYEGVSGTLTVMMGISGTEADNARTPHTYQLLFWDTLDW